MANTYENGMPRIHASRFGGTVRTIFLECSGYQQDPAPDWLQKAFKEGTKFEKLALKQFKKKFGVSHIQQFDEDDEFMEYTFKFKSGLNFIVTASTDAQLTEDFYYKGHLYPVGTFIEVKNMSAGNMKKIFGTTRMKLKNKQIIPRLRKYWPKYWMQFQMYLLMHKKLGLPYERALFLFRDKDADIIKLIPITYDEKTIKQLLKMGKDVAKCFRDNVQPECECIEKMCRFEMSCRSEKTEGIEKSVKNDTEDYKQEQFMIPPSYVMQVAGITFRKKALDLTLKEMAKVFEGIVLPTEIKTFFEHEPDNKFDPNAIKVMMKVSKKKRHVGYVPGKYQKHVEGLMVDNTLFTETHKLGYNKNKPFISIIIRAGR